MNILKGTVAVAILMELGVANPMPAFDAPAVSHKLQQGFWGGSQAGEEVVGCLERHAVAAAGGAHLNDPAGAGPGFFDGLRCLSGT